MYAIYGNIYHQHTPNVSIYTSTMDPMGYGNHYLDVPTVAYSEYFRHDSPGGPLALPTEPQVSCTGMSCGKVLNVNSG